MYEPIEYRTAVPADTAAIVSMFKAAIKHMNDNGIYQWDDIYPDAFILNSDIKAGQLTIGELNGTIAAAFTLNQDFDEEYNTGAWRYNTLQFMILHRLCVNPAFQNRGIGRNAMLYIEAKIKKEGIECLRLDAFSQNPYSIKLYESLGYQRAGEVEFRKGIFYLYEKKL